MAVDTAAKRASLIGYGLPFRLMLPFADGSIDAGDRAHLLGLYGGITAVTVYTPAFGTFSFEVRSQGAFWFEARAEASPPAFGPRSLGSFANFSPAY